MAQSQPTQIPLGLIPEFSCCRVLNTDLTFSHCGSLLANANGASAGGPFQIPGYASYGTALPSMSVGPVGGTHVFGDGLNTGLSLGKTPTAIVNGKPVYSDDPSDPFGGVLQNKAAPMYGRSAAPIGTAGPFGSSALVGSAAPFGSAAPVAIPYGTTRVPNTYGSAMPYSYGSAAPYGRSAAPYDGRSAAPYGSARPDSSKPIYPKGRADACSTIYSITHLKIVCVCV